MSLKTRERDTEKKEQKGVGAGRILFLFLLSSAHTLSGFFFLVPCLPHLRPSGSFIPQPIIYLPFSRAREKGERKGIRQTPPMGREETTPEGRQEMSRLVSRHRCLSFLSSSRAKEKGKGEGKIGRQRERRREAYNRTAFIINCGSNVSSPIDPPS